MTLLVIKLCLEWWELLILLLDVSFVTKFNLKLTNCIRQRCFFLNFDTSNLHDWLNQIMRIFINISLQLNILRSLDFLDVMALIVIDIIIQAFCCFTSFIYQFFSFLLLLIWKEVFMIVLNHDLNCFLKTNLLFFLKWHHFLNHM